MPRHPSSFKMTSLIAMPHSGNHTDGSSGQTSFRVSVQNCSPGLASRSFNASLRVCINWLPWEQALRRDLLASNLLRMRSQEKLASRKQGKSQSDKAPGRSGEH